MKIHFSLLVIILSFSLNAAPKQNINTILETITKSSLKIDERNDLMLSNISSLNSQESIFTPSLYMRSSFSETQNIPTSPFSATQTRLTQYEVGTSKLWKNGIISSVSYIYNDQATYFDARDNFFVKAPTLEFAFTTSLLQDLVGGRYKALANYIDLTKDSEKLSSKIDKKLILATSLMDITTIMQTREALQLQKGICKETKNQVGQLEAKIKRRSVSRRNYLLGKKELSNCLAAIENYEKELDELLTNFKSNYNLSFDSLGLASLEDIFDQVKKLYEELNKNPTRVRKNLSDEISLSQTMLSALMEKRTELDALKSTNIALELRTGLSGVGSNYEDSNQELVDQNYPYVYLGVQIDFPFENRASAHDFIANEYAIKATEKNKKQLTIQKANQFALLKRTLESHFIIYKKYRETLSLSKEVVKEANLDFRNGRIDFNDLLDFNKSSLEDQRTLAAHRLNLLVDLITYLDFYQFFDVYVASSL